MIKKPNLNAKPRRDFIVFLFTHCYEWRDNLELIRALEREEARTEEGFVGDEALNTSTMSLTPKIVPAIF